MLAIAVVNGKAQRVVLHLLCVEDGERVSVQCQCQCHSQYLASEEGSRSTSNPRFLSLVFTPGGFLHM